MFEGSHHTGHLATPPSGSVFGPPRIGLSAVCPKEAGSSPFLCCAREEDTFENEFCSGMAESSCWCEFGLVDGSAGDRVQGER